MLQKMPIFIGNFSVHIQIQEEASQFNFAFFASLLLLYDTPHSLKHHQVPSDTGWMWKGAVKSSPNHSLQGVEFHYGEEAQQ